MKSDALKIIASALKAADPYANTYDAVSKKNYDDNITVISVGKAACSMAKAAYDALGGRIRQGFVLTKYGHVTALPPIFTVREAGHPIPDENSVKYTCEITDAVSRLNPEEKIIFLLSGGGSSLFESPIISLSQLQSITDTMLRSGADITEINAVRKLFSLVKGGKFAQNCPCSIDCYILSDVLGDNPAVIASGPCCYDDAALKHGMETFNKYFDKTEIDDSLSEKIHSSFRLHNTASANIQIVGNINSLCNGAAAEAEKLGYYSRIVTTNLTGEAKTQAEMIVDSGSEYASVPHKPAVFIYGGETTVKVKGKGKGGRNQEAALAAAIRLKNTENILFFAFGSDGTDGPTDAAGGFADGETYNKLIKNNIDPMTYLDNNDSYNALKACNELLITGATGTNVNDIFAVIIK